MKAGKDYLADKPGITTLEQLAAVRKAVKDTGRKFAIMYSERLEVRSAVYAGELIKQGAIGRVIQTVNLAPHRVNAPSRPEWFFDKARYGGILTDIGSHQADQFLYYTNSTKAQGRRRADRQSRLSAVPEVRRFRRHGDVAATAARATCAWTGSRPTASPPGATGACSCSAPRATSSCASTSTSPRASTAAITCTSSTRSRRATSTARTCRCRSARSSSPTSSNRTQVAQDQEQALLAAELVLKAQNDRDAADHRLRSTIIEGDHETHTRAAVSRHCCFAPRRWPTNPPARPTCRITPRASTRSAKPPAGTSRCRGTRPRSAT